MLTISPQMLFFAPQPLTHTIMGLDQYAYTRKGKTQTEIAYWRKHNALQGWMETLWESKGFPRKHKEDSSFNCVELRIVKKDLDQLEKDVVAGKLPKTQGFFFGSDSSENEEYKRDTLEFVANARQLIAEGKRVYYNSWW